MGWFGRHAEEQVAVVADRQERIEKDMRRTAQEIGALTAALVVREPATATAAQAYDGLRKAVMAGAQARRELLVSLVELTELLDHDADIDDVRSFVEELRFRAHLTQDGDAKARPMNFEVLDGAGTAVQVRKAAWVDEQTGALIKRGIAERVAAQPKALPKSEVVGSEDEGPPPRDAQKPQDPKVADRVSPSQATDQEVSTIDLDAGTVESPERPPGPVGPRGTDDSGGAASTQEALIPVSEEPQHALLENDTEKATDTLPPGQDTSTGPDTKDTTNMNGQGE